MSLGENSQKSNSTLNLTLRSDTTMLNSASLDPRMDSPNTSESAVLPPITTTNTVTTTATNTSYADPTKQLNRLAVDKEETNEAEALLSSYVNGEAVMRFKNKSSIHTGEEVKSPESFGKEHSTAQLDQALSIPVDPDEALKHKESAINDKSEQSSSSSGDESDNCECYPINKCKPTLMGPFANKSIISKSISSRFVDIRSFTFFMCLIVMLTNALSVGYRNSVITTIEKRFEISSVLSGVLSGCMEFGSLITTLLVSYFFSTSHIPRSIAASSLCCAIGSLLYALPHLISGSYTLNNRVMNKSTDDLICRTSSFRNNRLNQTSMSLIANRLNETFLAVDYVNVNDTKIKNNFNGLITSSLFLKDNYETNEALAQAQQAAAAVISFLNPFDISEKCLLKPSNYGIFTILIIANVLIGCSSAPLYTLGTTYIDNHVTKENSSVYLGIK
jgi:hypothetical protein